MNSPLRPCPACARHVRTNESSCPFCQRALTDEFRGVRPPTLPRARLTRAAVFAVGASLSMAPAACGDDTDKSNDAGMADAGNGGSSGAQGGAGGGSTATGGTGGNRTGTGGGGGASPGTGGSSGIDAGRGGAGGSGTGGTSAPSDGGRDTTADLVIDTRPSNEVGGPVPVYGAPPPPK